MAIISSALGWRFTTVAVVVVASVLVALAWPHFSDGGLELAAQGNRPRVATPRAIDYEAGAKLRERTQGKVLNEKLDSTWISPTKLLYRLQTGNETWQYRIVDANTKRSTEAFNHDRMATSVRRVLGDQQVQANRLPILAVRVDEQGRVYGALRDGPVVLLDFAKATAEALDALENTPFDLKPTNGDRSESGSGSTQIVFDNTSGGPVDVFWVSTATEVRKYGTIEARSRRSYQTYDGHLWMVKSPEGIELGRYRAVAHPGYAKIDGTVQYTPRRIYPNAITQTQTPDAYWLLIVWQGALSVSNRESGVKFELKVPIESAALANGSIECAPNSKLVAGLSVIRGKPSTLTTIEATPGDGGLPKTTTISYARPGDVIDAYRPVIFDLENRRVHVIDDAEFPNPWAIRDMAWSADSLRLSFVYNERGHGRVRVIEVDAKTLAARVVIDETSKTFVDYANKLYLNRLPETGEAIWMSERSGWNHLYLWDVAKGAVKNPITQGEWVVRAVQHVDASTRKIWFSAMGVWPKQDPYHLHYGVVDFDGSNLTWLTKSDGTHSIEFSPDRQYVIATHSRVDLAPVHELRSTRTGELVCEIAAADVSAMSEAGWNAPVRFNAPGRDGETSIWGYLVFPSWAKAGEKFPVIECIYAGPHGQHVSKNFSAWQGERELSELGFVVARIDGMGTNWRSKAFHDVCHLNLADAGFADRKLFLTAAAKAYPSMDLSRVGIYGGSAGGQSAVRALIDHSDFYHAAAADCGCHDNRLDKIWWNEMWMGWPVGPHYAKQSNITDAHKVNGKLLLTVGALDTNVDPSSTYRVAERLIAAGKEFEYMVFPNLGHGAGESAYGRRLRARFFVRTLIGQ